MRILVTGASGYVGSALVPSLLSEGHEICAVDTMWFGCNLDTQENLTILENRVSSLSAREMNGTEVVIHLANIANDPSVDLNPLNAWETNLLEFQNLLEISKKTGVRRIIYASSGSVYGVKKEERVTEELSLTPISVYNKTKLIAERLAISYQNNMEIFIARPATICGRSRRMRFDVVVNLFVLQAFSSGAIKVMGGSQVRPNIHIEDMVGAYLHLLRLDKSLAGVYNVGFENMTVQDIAKRVSGFIASDLEFVNSNDPRSYRLDSSKLIRTGFSPKKGVDEAIQEVYTALCDGSLKDDPKWHTVKWMKENGIQ